jgi:hypothetical protein
LDLATTGVVGLVVVAEEVLTSLLASTFFGGKVTVCFGCSLSNEARPLFPSFFGESMVVMLTIQDRKKKEKEKEERKEEERKIPFYLFIFEAICKSHTLSWFLSRSIL